MFSEHFLVAEACSKAVYEALINHGKSPCFSRCSIMRLITPDSAMPCSALADVETVLD
jgi:hypothetical protein